LEKGGGKKSANQRQQLWPEGEGVHQYWPGKRKRIQGRGGDIGQGLLFPQKSFSPKKSPLDGKKKGMGMGTPSSEKGKG